MPTLPELFPDPNDLLAMPVEGLAPTLLCLAEDRTQNGMVHLASVTSAPLGQPLQYPPHD